MSDARRSSILKPPKQRAPLQEVNSLNIHHHDDFTSTTVTQNIMRRVSFAGTSTVKEFDAQAESVLVCHTPAYEESFAASDSSLPSDHSSRLSSRSTISIEDQSTHSASSKGTLYEIVHAEDELFVDFGVPKPSQPADRDAQRRSRFSIGATSDEEESPKVQEKGLSTIPPSLFFGKEKPKAKKGVMSSPQLLKIDPFSLRPKPVTASPKPHLKRMSVGPTSHPSPKSKSPALRFAPSPNDSTSSEMELTEAISGNIFITTPSPSSVASGATPQSVLTPRSMEFTSVGTPDWKNKTTLDGDMDLTRVMPTKILDRTETSSSAPGDGSLHCTFRNSVMMEFPQPVTGVAIRNEQRLVTGANQSVSCTINSVVTGLSRKDNDVTSLPATEDMKATEMVYRNEGSCLESGTRSSTMEEVMDNVPVAGLNTTVRDSEGMKFTEVVSSLPVLENVNSDDARDGTVCEPDGMDFTRVIPGLPVLDGDGKQCRGPLSNQTLNDSAGMELTEAMPSVPVLQETRSNPTACNATLNKTLNDSVGMDLTEAIPYVPQLHTPGLGKSFCVEQLSKTFNDSVGMELTKVIPTAPQLHTPGLNKSFGTEPVNKTLNDTVGMELTKAIPTAPQLHTSGLSKSFRAEPLNKTLNDTVGMELTKVIPTAPISSEHVAQKTPCDSVDMDFTQTVSARQFGNISGDATGSLIPASDGKNTLPDSVGVEFTKVVTTPELLDSSKANESFKSSSSKPVEIKQSLSADPVTISMTPETFIPVSVNDTSIQRTESTTLTKLSTDIRTASTSLVQSSDTEASLSKADDIHTNLPSQTQGTVSPSYVEANVSRIGNFPSSQMPVQDQTRLLEGDLANTGDGIASSQGTSPQTTLPSHPLLPKSQVSRKRPIGEVDDAEPGELASQASRSLVISAPIAPPEIVIPSSRSPSPVEEDSSIRFPGLSQSFSANRSLRNSQATPTVNPSVRDDPVTQDHHHTSPAKTREAFGCVTSEHPSSILVEAVNLPVPVDTATELESDGSPSSSTSEVLRKFTTPDECNLTDVSLKTKSLSPDLSCSPFETGNVSHKLILDVSVPSMLENSDWGVEQEVSSNARLYATLLEADNNVSLFHQEREGNASSVEESTNVCCGEVERKDISEEHGICRGDSSNVSEEPGRKEERRELPEKWEESAFRTRKDKAVERSVPVSLTNSVLPSDSPCLIEADRRRLFDRTSTSITGVSRLVAASRTAEEIIRIHRLEYRKRERCNWTWQKLSDGEWSFYYLDDSVELRIKVEESNRNEPLSAHGGRFISLLDDSRDGLWHIGGRLLYQMLSSEEWTSRLRETADVLSLVEDVNRVANNVEKFKTTLAYLQITKNIDITNDWICFDVLSRKTSNIWFKVKVDCRDVFNLQPSHVSIENIIGETRQIDIQNLVTCLKKGPYILKNYVAVVEEYLETIERIQ